MVMDIHFTARLRDEGGWFAVMGGLGSRAGTFFFFDMAAESIAHGPFIFLQLIDSFIILPTIAIGAKYKSSGSFRPLGPEFQEN